MLFNEEKELKTGYFYFTLQLKRSALSKGLFRRGGDACLREPPGTDSCKIAVDAAVSLTAVNAEKLTPKLKIFQSSTEKFSAKMGWHSACNVDDIINS